jgi:hypothetical protein
MGDLIRLTIPSSQRYRGVATLVLGGIGSRLELPYERVDDLSLALVSVFDAGATEKDTTVEIAAHDGELSIAVGPLAPGAAGDPALVRVLDPLVDEVRPLERDGDEWIELRVAGTGA